jgi:hypothetical protein
MNDRFLAEKEDEQKKQLALKTKRVTSLAGVFGKALSVLTSHKINVSVVDRPEMQAPAWSSTKEVWLNLPEIKDDFTPRSITSLNGLSFHELGHLKYTPRNGSRLVGMIKDDSDSQELWQAFNCLEDSRIELLLTGWLPSIKSWLTATIVDYLMKDSEAIERAFPLVYGRKYLPVELRQIASDNFMKPNLQADFARVIDDYNSLTLTGSDEHTDFAFSLIKEFAELLRELPSMGNAQQGEGVTVVIRIKNPHGHDSRPAQGYESSSNRPASKSEQEAHRQQSKKNVVEVVIDMTREEKSKDDSTPDSQSQQQGEPT